MLNAYHWPGNLRQLRNVLERARLFADEGEIQAKHLPPELQGSARGDEVAPETARAPLTTVIEQPIPYGPVSAPQRHRLTEAALSTFAAEFTGTRREMAQALGLSERTLYRRLHALGLI